MQKKVFKKFTVFVLIIISTVMLFSFIVMGCDLAPDSDDSDDDNNNSSSVISSVASSISSETSSVDSSTSSESASSTSTYPTVFLVGDSTVCTFNDAYYYPRYGYGTKIGNYLDANVIINNLALSGRSSKSFIIEANYTALTSSIKSGDYLIIGFGHNDEKAEVERYTDPTGTITDATSFKYYLYNYYVKIDQDAGAIPILCTPVVRRSTSGTYTGANIHITETVVSGGVTYNGGDYAQCIRDLGTDLGVTVIDNTNLTKTLNESLFASSGAAATADLHAWVSNNVSSVDDTHLNIYGASYVAYLMADAVNSSACTLKNYVLAGITAPDKATTLIPNPDYVPIVYNPPTVKSTIWTTTDPWWGTVFGDCGGQTKITDGISFAITEGATNVTLRSGTETGAVGKIAGTTDCIAMYFQQIPADKDFTLTATATVNFIASNNQVSFGLMLRDAAWIDIYDPSLVSNYVAAGPLKIASTLV